MRHPLVLILLTTALAACKTVGGADRGLDRAEQMREVRVADVASDPDRYMGQTVSVVSEVDDIFGHQAFALDEDAWLAGGIDNDLLVIAKSGSGLILTDQWQDKKVRVTGTVGKWSLIEIERELGFDLDPQLELEIERSGAVLLADTVTPLED